MTDFDPQFERDLKLLKNSIQPSSGLRYRIKGVTEIRSTRYTGYHMAIAKFLIPAAAAIILVIAVISVRDRGAQPIGGQDVTGGEVDSMITSLVSDAEAEQSIANESDDDVQLVDSDRAELDAFAATYNSNEY